MVPVGVSDDRNGEVFVGIKNRITRRRKVLKCNSRFPRLGLRANKIKYGKKLRLIGWPFIFRYPGAKIEIGDEVTINSSFFSNLIGLYQRTIIVARGDGEIQIGDKVGISGSTLYARKRIVVGDGTLIGANTKIFDNDFHSLVLEERMADDYSHLTTKPVEIGKHVFIGCNCIILKGTKLGDGCVVGAGSVVHGEFEEGTVLAGNPAQVIKRNGRFDGNHSDKE